MTKSDDVILEFLDKIDIAVPPQVIAFNVSNISQPTVDRRLPKLAAAGLLKRYEEPRGYTEITSKGRASLHGELRVEELENAAE